MPKTRLHHGRHYKIKTDIQTLIRHKMHLSNSQAFGAKHKFESSDFRGIKY